MNVCHVCALEFLFSFIESRYSGPTYLLYDLVHLPKPFGYRKETRINFVALSIYQHKRLTKRVPMLHLHYANVYELSIVNVDNLYRTCFTEVFANCQQHVVCLVDDQFFWVQNHVFVFLKMYKYIV